MRTAGREPRATGRGPQAADRGPRGRKSRAAGLPHAEGCAVGRHDGKEAAFDKPRTPEGDAATLLQP